MICSSTNRINIHSPETNGVLPTLRTVHYNLLRIYNHWRRKETKDTYVRKNYLSLTYQETSWIKHEPSIVNFCGLNISLWKRMFTPALCCLCMTTTFRSWSAVICQLCTEISLTATNSSPISKPDHSDEIKYINILFTHFNLWY